jgi:hypothetical protein
VSGFTEERNKLLTSVPIRTIASSTAITDKVLLEQDLGCSRLALCSDDSHRLGHLIEPRHDADSHETEDAVERWDHRLLDVVDRVESMSSGGTRRISWANICSQTGGSRVGDKVCGTERPINLLGAWLGLDKHVRHSFAVLGLAARVVIHGTLSDHRAWRWSPSLSEVRRRDIRHKTPKGGPGG